MNINIRRAIALGFIIAFFITAPLLIFYTAGFRYNFKKAQVQRTGTLIVKTTPKNAQVLLNGKTLANATPVRENNILPDEYSISIEKNNYYPWQKKMSIKPQETTFIEDVILFPKSQPEKISDNQISFLSFSPGGNYALFSTKEFNQDFLYLLNLNNFRQKLIFNNDKNWSTLSVLWSQDEAKALIDIEGQLIVATTLFPQQKINVQKQISNITPDIIKFKWDAIDSNILYSQEKNSINEINLLALTSTKIFTGAKNQVFDDFLIKNDEIYLIENIDNKKFLTKQKTNEATKLAAIELKAADYSFKGFIKNYLVLFENNYQTIFLVNPGLDKIVLSKENIQNIELSERNNLLAITTKQEISYIKIDENELREKNITRYSNGLNQSHWAHATANYLFTLQNKKISVLELDDRDKRFMLEFPIENITEFIVNSNDEAIVFLKDSYLYQLPITE